jgi:hypothetical protein
MSREKNVVVNAGSGPLTLLLIAFIVLKLTNLITWSWLWVLSPIWLPFAAVIIFVIFAAIIAVILGK